MKFEIYSKGLVSMSICTDLEEEKDIEAIANTQNPTGIESKWKISKDTHFSSGETNPCECEQDSDSRHFLLEC